MSAFGKWPLFVTSPEFSSDNSFLVRRWTRVEAFPPSLGAGIPTVHIRDERKSDSKNRNSEIGSRKPQNRPEYRKRRRSEVQRVQCVYANICTCIYQIVAKLIAEIDSPVQSTVTLFILNFTYQNEILQILHISANDPNSWKAISTQFNVPNQETAADAGLLREPGKVIVGRGEVCRVRLEIDEMNVSWNAHRTCM
ncbi:hypothetical protein Y032_0130g1533 [Ancylostoma ceylanicum]|uniref:Uncharacterized protein n=1 Tax=Ancylostoma ceylanicum TaxID=53326 RepID=A0A016T7E8_9BILA|nr:hypothetical protein Y032_0130g1533 [Ancylostoma ceylanicum]